MIELSRRKCPFVLCVVLAAIVCVTLFCANAAQKSSSSEKAPAVTKVEPPNWWVGLTPEVMVLLSGRGVDATQVECNLSSIIVERTRATAGGDFFFVWVTFGR